MQLAGKSSAPPRINGAPISGATPGSSLFVGAGGVLAQDNANYKWDEADSRLDVNNIVSMNAPVIDVFNRYRAVGATSTLATRYSTLAEAQTAYPLAGITSLNDYIDWAAVQQAIYENINNGETGRILELGDHNYFTGNGKTFGIRISGDYSAALHFRGGGSRGTRFTQTDAAVANFELYNQTTGNLRDIILERCHFWEGKISINIRRVGYSRFIDCSTFRPGGGGVNTGTDYQSISAELTHNTWFTRFMVQHSVTADFLYANNSTLWFSDCQIGEDAGGIFAINGTILNFVNCNAVEIKLAVEPSGTFLTASGAIYLADNCSLTWIGGQITPNVARTCVILADNALSVDLIGCQLNGVNTEALIGLDRVPSTFRCNIIGVTGTLPAGGSIIKLYDNLQPIKNTQIDNLRIRVAGGARSDVYTDDSLFDPQYNNEIGSILVVPA